jgi:hypothetical protein
MRRLAYTLVAAALFSACGNTGSNSATSPTTPTPTAPAGATVTTVTVTSASASASMFQLTASARFSDGTAREVTTSARWDSSNAAVALVSQSGLVTIVATGDVEVRATYQGVTGSFPLKVAAPPPRVTLRGMVWEVPPHQRPLAGARVEIMDGPDKGKSTVADSTGTYRLSGLSSGVLVLGASLDGYQNWEGGLTLSSDRQQDAWLTPKPPKDATGAPATARCEDGTWSWSQDVSAVCAANGGIAYVVCPGLLCRT